MIILGIDPGANTGVATYHDGKLTSLQTIQPHRIPEIIRATGVGRVVFEDSRLQTHVWKHVTSRPAALKMARNIGEIDAWCRLITATCEDIGIPAHGISPKSKGAKLDAKQFAAATGWTARSNEHERDGAMVAWRFRSAA